LPRTAAVVMTCEGDSASYAEALRKAKEKIPLAELNITDTRIRRAATGAVIIEIPGEGMRAKADLLANRMREELRELGARITRPTRVAEIRVYNFDDSVTDQDLLNALMTGKRLRPSGYQIETEKADEGYGPSGPGVPWRLHSDSRMKEESG